MYKTELETVIQDETGGDFTSALLAMLKANKDESKEVDMSLAQKDAEVTSTFKCRRERYTILACESTHSWFTTNQMVLVGGDEGSCFPGDIVVSAAGRTD